MLVAVEKASATCWTPQAVCRACLVALSRGFAITTSSLRASIISDFANSSFKEHMAGETFFLIGMVIDMKVSNRAGFLVALALRRRDGKSNNGAFPLAMKAVAQLDGGLVVVTAMRHDEGAAVGREVGAVGLVGGRTGIVGLCAEGLCLVVRLGLAS